MSSKDLLKFEPEFISAFLNHFEKCERQYDDYMAKAFPTLLKNEGFSYQVGSRYIKIVRDGSVFSFIDVTNGAVLKAASWRAPAKHARGNIFDESNGMKHVTVYGPNYLR